ncbi:hypothetical protein LTR05_008434 [Lithohypha guttulata]|uniref:Heterokaryon incompatibility domain-containing protein n=1 Tax=Lithohypha guttulata TaxID=1690604 RepID=A0AAN7ST86_9EURO|nr:hypothetical protein LTR05_008434 [Lithohypha guttulata]
MSGAPYAYRLIGVRIPTIRLVRITGRREDGSVLLQLECFPLADVIDKYIAISYTWGLDNKIRRVWIGTKYVVIRENIWQFLLHCAQHQHIVSDSWLWIDSICINQTNTAEKNRQVQLMGRIFSGTAHVLIWLGSSSQRNLKLLEDARTSATQNDNHTKAQSSDHRYESEITWSWQEWRSFVKSDDESRVGDWWRPYVDDVKDVLYNEYWHRLWIAQEVKLAQSAKLIFGTMTLDIQQLESINLLYETLRDEQRSVDEQYYRFSRSKTPATNIVSQHPLLCRGAPSLHKFLYVYRNQQCADPRDKVYGLLGLAGIDGTFAIDYRCAKENLFMQVLNHIGSQRRSTADPVEFQDIELHLAEY